MRCDGRIEPGSSGGPGTGQRAESRGVSGKGSFFSFVVPTFLDAAAAEALNACRDRVEAADKVLKEAKTGIGHWEAHVDAERRAEAGTISIADRQEIFKETRLKGPGDQKRYADALRAYEKVRDASCGRPIIGATGIFGTLSVSSQTATSKSKVL